MELIMQGDLALLLLRVQIPQEDSSRVILRTTSVQVDTV